MKRVLTALIGIPLLIWVIEFAPVNVCIGLIVIAAVLALHEFFSLVEISLSFRLAGFLIAGIALFVFQLPRATEALFAGVMLMLTVALFSGLELATAFRSAAFGFFGAVYVGGLMSYLIALRMADAAFGQGGNLMMMLFCVIWTGDSFAYFVGKSIGRHQLAPVVSPKKTWEGAIAGFIFSIAAALACRYTFVSQITLKDAIIIGILVGIAGQVGDLGESIIKRAVQVKDSGQILPGHGGVLDRIDSLLFAAPAMYYYLFFLRP
jgi:phosphatidate cytidylyltransferase